MTTRTTVVLLSFCLATACPITVFSQDWPFRKSPDRSTGSDHDRETSGNTSGPSISPATAVLREGNGYLEKGDYATAETCYRRALDLSPSPHTRRDAHFNLGIALNYQHRFAEALDEVRIAKQLGFKDTDNFEMSVAGAMVFVEAKNAYDRKDFKQAEERYRASLTLWDEPSGHYNLARSLELQGQYVEAEEEFRKAEQGYTRGPLAESQGLEATRGKLKDLAPLARQQRDDRRIKSENAKNVVTVRNNVERLSGKLASPSAISEAGLDIMTGDALAETGKGTSYGQAVQSAQTGKQAVEASSDAASKEKSGICSDGRPGCSGAASPEPTPIGSAPRGSASLSQATRQVMKRTAAGAALLDKEAQATSALTEASEKVRHKEAELAAAPTPADKGRLQVEVSAALQDETNARSNAETAQVKVEEAARVIEEVQLLDTKSKPEGTRQ
jgi:hypothetical protein